MTGAEIRAARKRTGFTQEQFAYLVGVTVATVNRWENGKVKLSRLALKSVEHFFSQHDPERRVA